MNNSLERGSQSGVRTHAIDWLRPLILYGFGAPLNVAEVGVLGEGAVVSHQLLGLVGDGVEDGFFAAVISHLLDYVRHDL